MLNSFNGINNLISGSVDGLAGPGVGAIPPGQGGQGTVNAQRVGPTPGQNQVAPPHALRSVMPPFMFRGGQIPPGSYPVGYQGTYGPRGPVGGRHPPPPSQDGRFRQGPRLASPANQGDPELYPRPIIKEEDLRRMDEISGDDGWAALQDEPDYDKKLFDDEMVEEVKERHNDVQVEEEVKVDRDGKWADNIQAEGRALVTPPATNPQVGGRAGFSQPMPRQQDMRQQIPNSRALSLDEDEFWIERQRQQKNEEMKAAIRAKERR